MSKKVEVNVRKKMKTSVVQTQHIGINHGVVAFNVSAGSGICTKHCGDMVVMNNFSARLSNATSLLCKYDAKSARRFAKQVHENVADGNLGMVMLHSAIEAGQLSCVIKNTDKEHLCDLRNLLSLMEFKCVLTEEDDTFSLHVDWSGDNDDTT
jgi:hypothetical protein